MPPQNKTCNLCGLTGLHWKAVASTAVSPPGEKFVLADPITGDSHTCPPVTTARAVHTTAPTVPKPDTMPEQVKRIADAAVLDMVAKVTESFQRTIDTRSQAAEQDLNALVQDTVDRLARDVHNAYDQALSDFRDLMPQQHDLCIHTPDLTTTIPGVKPHYQLQRMVD